MGARELYGSARTSNGLWRFPSLAKQLTPEATVGEGCGPQMIERFLRGHGLKFPIDQRGDFLVDFDGDNLRDYPVLRSES